MSRKLSICLLAAAALAIAACAASPAPAAKGPGVFKPVADTGGPLPLREPIEGVMVGVIDFSSHGIFSLATSKSGLTDQDWFAAGLAALNLIGSSTLITVPGTGDNDAVWAADPKWRTYAAAMQAASVDAGVAVRNRDRVALLLAADRLAEACQACHDAFRPDLPKVEGTQLASLR